MLVSIMMELVQWSGRAVCRTVYRMYLYRVELTCLVMCMHIGPTCTCQWVLICLGQCWSPTGLACSGPIATRYLRPPTRFPLFLHSEKQLVLWKVTLSNHSVSNMYGIHILERQHNFFKVFGSLWIWNNFVSTFRYFQEYREQNSNY